MSLLGKFTFSIALALPMANATWAQAQSVNKVGPGGGSVYGAITQKGNSVSGSLTATGGRGGTASGAGLATYNARSGVVTGSGSGSSTTAKGQSVSAQGSGSYNTQSGAYSGQGQLTGAQGDTVGGSIAGGNGSSTVTRNNGVSKTRTAPSKTD